MLKRAAHADDREADKHEGRAVGEHEQHIASSRHAQPEHKQIPVAETLGRDAGYDFKKALNKALYAFEQADYTKV